MKVYYIVTLMIVTLALLFIFLPIFRKKEMINSKIEILYFESLKDAFSKSQSTEEIFTSVRDHLSKYYKSEDKDFLLEKLKIDLTAFGETK